LIGIPDHQGVINVGGRIGSIHGPREFRKIFMKMKGRNGVLESMLDRGDVAPLTTDIQANHKAAAHLIHDAHTVTDLSVVVGGGHDHGYSHLLGLTRGSAKKPHRLACINIDAHLDVRQPSPQITSGSPFYLAIEAKILDPGRFVEFGIQSHCNAPELWKYVESKRVRVLPFELLRGGLATRKFSAELKRLSTNCDAIAISLDLDAVSSAFAPGVSAPQAEGFTSDEIIEMMEVAGRTPKVKSLGIFELNPAHDRDDQTSRLAATAAYHFISHALQRR
jgi:formiminoglutamase